MPATPEAAEAELRRLLGDPGRILAFAYACEPGKGSEPGAGWAWARMLARLGETWVVTRANNRGPIEAALSATPESGRLRVVYVDLPPWARVWKRGQRGVRLYYLLWQLAALQATRRLRRERSFDLVWHLTLANAWFGSLAPLAGGRFVYGPVGGGVRTPWRLAPALGFRGIAYELTRELARAAGRYLNPMARLAWRRAALVLVQNPETARWLPRRHRAKAAILPNAVLAPAEMPSPPGSHRPSPGDRLATALFAGRLLPLKGLALALRALAQAPRWRLVVYGEGPDRRRLERLARRLGLAERVEFRGWAPREEVWRAMREEADVFLFPSLHDEAPLAVIEAGSCGLPVLALAVGGPAVLPLPGGRVISVAGSCREVAQRLAEALRELEPASHAAREESPRRQPEEDRAALFCVRVHAGVCGARRPGAGA